MLYTRRPSYVTKTRMFIEPQLVMKRDMSYMRHITYVCIYIYNAYIWYVYYTTRLRGKIYKEKWIFNWIFIVAGVRRAASAGLGWAINFFFLYWKFFLLFVWRWWKCVRRATAARTKISNLNKSAESTYILLYTVRYNRIENIVGFFILKNWCKWCSNNYYYWSKWIGPLDKFNFF